VRLSILSTVLVGVALAGCEEVPKATTRTWHEKFGWKAEDYFEDPSVVALCHAIEASDIAEINRLVAGGANVNAKGKDNMTPLLWAFPDKKPECFKRLLELGADPNVAIKSDLNTRGGFAAGDSVTHMACRTEFPGYFEAVFAHGGDPNFVRNWHIKGITPLFAVIMGAGSNKNSKVHVLVDKGAELNHADSTGTTPVMVAVGWGGSYDLAITLLNAGADYNTYKPKSNTKLVHIVASEERRKPMWTPQQADDYQKLVAWLEKHGESIDTAKADVKRWQSWNTTPAEFRRKMDAEIAARKAKEEQDKAAAKEPNNPAK
jgi:uncharacterized protein